MPNSKTNYSSKIVDITGTLASTLCLIHCLTTPLLILGFLGIATMENSIQPLWEVLDWFFLVITLMAVYRSSTITKSKSLPYFFWISWTLLLLIVLNERLGLVSAPEWIIVIPSFSLIALHLYNLKYCR